MALFKVIALHIVDLFPTCLGNGGIVTTCVLCSTRTDDELEAGLQLEGPPVSDDNEETLTRAGRSESRSSCTVNSGTGIGDPERRLAMGLYGFLPPRRKLRDWTRDMTGTGCLSTVKISQLNAFKEVTIKEPTIGTAHSSRSYAFCRASRKNCWQFSLSSSSAELALKSQNALISAEVANRSVGHRKVVLRLLLLFAMVAGSVLARNSIAGYFMERYAVQ